MSGSPDYVATMDQLAAMVGPLAKVMSAYFFALLTEGFTVEQAFGLTLAYQSCVVRGREN